MSKRTSGKSAIIVLVFVALGCAAGAYFFLGNAEVTNPGPSAQAADDPNREMTDEERAEYIKANVTVTDLKIVPDTKPGLDEVVPGLLRVVGTVSNNGPRPLAKAYLHIFPKDKMGKVLGSHIENLAKKGGPMAPGESREIRFLIPEKKEFAGDFGHDLR